MCSVRNLQQFSGFQYFPPTLCYCCHEFNCHTSYYLAPYTAPVFALVSQFIFRAKKNSTKDKINSIFHFYSSLFLCVDPGSCLIYCFCSRNSTFLVMSPSNQFRHFCLFTSHPSLSPGYRILG